MVILLAVFLSVLGPDTRHQRTIVIPTDTGKVKITFDTTRVSENELRRWMRLSHNVSTSNSYELPEWIQLCIKGDPDYRECGTRDWMAKNFSYNANVNLQKIQKRIKELDEASYPPELRELVSYMKKIQEDQLFFQGQELKFYENWQTDDLATQFDGIDPGRQCSAEIRRIGSTPDKQTAYNLVYKQWWNCVNHALRANAGEYPEAAWQNFLLKFSIREELIEDDGE